jgi:hypothetical protein
MPAATLPASSRSWFPAALATAAYVVSTLLILFASWRLADRHFIYPLDDTYINMAMAKQFAAHNVWGVTPYAFSSSTSSPLYVLLLSACYRLTGPLAWIPLLLSWGFGLASILVAGRMLASHLSPRWTTAVLLSFVLLTPVFAIGVLGMEHSLHLLLTLLFLEQLGGSDGKSRRRDVLLFTVTLCMVATRYEGLLAAGAAILLLAAGRRWRRVLLVAAAAALPVLLYAWFSVSHGGAWLPNSVLLKGFKTQGSGTASRLHSLAAATSDHLVRGPHLVFLTLALVIVFLALRRIRAPQALACGVLGIAGLLHLVAADVGWAFRYEDYLLGAGMVAVASAWPPLWSLRRRAAQLAILPLLLAAAVLGLRSGLAAAYLPHYAQSIYLQPWQTARFLRSNYAGATIAANDIGAINFAADLHCVDLAGLASAAIFEAKRRGVYTTRALDRIASAQGVQIAVVHDSWFAEHPVTAMGGPPLPASWVRVRRWSVREKYQLGGRTVSFYAVSPALAPELRARLDAFERTLPEGVAIER